MHAYRSEWLSSSPPRSAIKLCTVGRRFLFGILVVFASQGCGAKLSKNVVPESCSEEGVDPSLSRAPHFVTRQFKGAGTEGATILYSLDTKQMLAQPVIIKGSASTDALPLRDAVREQIFFLERFIGRPSRLTRVTCRTQGKALEKGNLPENTFAIGYVNAEQLAAFGWNTPVVRVFREDFDARSDSQGKIAIATAATGLTEADTHLNNLLVAGQNTYLVSSGYSFGSGQPTQARLYKLDSLFSEVERVYDIPACKNAYQDYTLQISAQQVVLGCNPQYAGPIAGQDVTLVSVRVSENEEPNFTVLTGPGHDAQIIVPAGVSNDGKRLFVAEYTTSVREQTLLPGQPLRSYWLNLQTNERIDAVGLSGSAIYDEIHQKYVFSCVVSANNGLCKNNVFGVADAPDGVPSSMTEHTVSFDYSFWQFERRLF